MQTLENYLNKIICGDSLGVMRQMPDESVDLVVTSPPYNLKNSTGNGMKAGKKSGSGTNNPTQNDSERKTTEVCNHCGCSVSMGSGNFVNRIPDFNDIFTRIVNNRPFPLGDFVCENCDNESLADEE